VDVLNPCLPVGVRHLPSLTGSRSGRRRLTQKIEGGGRSMSLEAS
jgi:hypothetical protein